MKISEYIAKQKKLVKHRFVLYDYKDYLSQLKKLGYPLEEYYLYPKNLEAAHAKLTNEMNRRRDEEKRKRIELQEKGYREILKKIKKLTYSSENLVIRPVNSIAELNTEGMKMHHCVATYRDKVVAEKCYIFTVRNINEPDEPLATLELSQDKKRIIQLRGKYNAVVSDDIEAFCNHWFKHIVNSKEKRKKAS